MSDLVKRLRDGEFSAEDVWEAADRLEALEAALRQARTLLVESALHNVNRFAPQNHSEIAALQGALSDINDLLKD